MPPQVSLKDAGRSHVSRNIGSLNIVNTDLHLVCKDGVVNTHQAVFSWASGFLRRILMSQLILEDGGKRKEDVTLHFPDFGVKVVSSISNFLVHGQLVVKENKSFQENFEEAWEAFRIDRITFKEVFDSGKLIKKSDESSMHQPKKSVSTPPSSTSRSLRATRSRPSVINSGVTSSGSLLPQQPLQPTGSNLKTKQKLKNPFSKQTVPPPGPPGPSVLGTSSPVVTNPTKKLPLSFLKKNQSILFKSPRFSSTPIRPFPKTNANVLPEKLFNNSEVSITLSSENGAVNGRKITTFDEDMPVIVEEVKGSSNNEESSLKDELPKGISITKQSIPLSSKATLTETKKVLSKPVKKSESQAKVPAYVKKITIKGHKKMIGSKLKRKDLKKKTFPVDKAVAKKSTKNNPTNNDVTIRRTSSRLSSGTFQSYNEELIENAVFEKKSELKKGSVSNSKKDVNQSSLIDKIDENRILNSTKKLTIPLKKVIDAKIPVTTKTLPMTFNPKEEPTKVKPITEAQGGNSVTITKQPSNSQTDTPGNVVVVAKDVTEKFKLPGSSKDITVSITRTTVPSPTVTDPELELLTCYVCNQTKDKEQRNLNLKNIFYVRSHISKCLYNVGKLFKAIPPGKDNTDERGFPVDEFGLKNGVWYNCEVEGCWLAQKKGVSGQVCYKVYAIHMASQHGALEMVMMEDGDKARELVEKLMDYEEKKKKDISMNRPTPSTLSIVKMEKPLDVTVEELTRVDEKKIAKHHLATPLKPVVARKSAPPSTPKSLAPPSTPKSLTSFFGKDGFHKCFLCHGTKKDGLGLSLKDLPKLKEHYSKCLYDECKFVKFVPPGTHNSDEMGNPIDELGVGYRCEIKGCWLQKKVGDQGKVCYKVLAHHMASQHGVLEKILETDNRPFMKELLKKIRSAAGQVKTAIVGCRFEECSKLKFKADNTREIKLHYAGAHFKSWFQVNPDTGMPDNFTKTGNRAVCGACTGNSNKPVYIQGEREAIRGHQVVKHDMLADVLIQAGETVKEAREVISDLYPERLADVYMDTLDKHTLPLNEDFMSKISL